MWYQFLYHVITILLATPQSIVGISQNPGLTLVNISLYKSSNSFKEKTNRTPLFMLFRETLRSGEDVPVNSSLKKLMGATADEAEGIQSKRRWPLPAANQHLWSCSWACCASWPCLGRKIERAQGISRHLKASQGLANARTPQLFSRFCSVLFFLVCVCVLGTFQHSFFIKKNIPTTWTPPCPI